MARRASSKTNPALIIGAIAAVVVLAFAGKSLLGKKSVAFEDGVKLDMAEVLENANMLRGNEYVVEGQVDEKLQWTSDRGQVVSLRIDTSGDDEFLGIEIPPELGKINISTKQKYSFRVKFRQGGIAVATGINRL
ncbi:MAG: hypothetical protein V4733_01950 [Verrucomicrobiota bacterium]